VGRPSFNIREPILPSSVQTANRDFMYAQSDYHFTRHLTGLVGFKYEDERGEVADTGYPTELAQRGNYSYTMQLAEMPLAGCITLSAAASRRTPCLELRLRLARLSPIICCVQRVAPAEWHQAPRQFRERHQRAEHRPASKLTGWLAIGAERKSAHREVRHCSGRCSDIKNLRWRYRSANVRRARQDQYHLLHNEFGNGVEFVPSQGLVALGLPTAVAQATEYGAYVNSLAYRAQGAEIETEYRLGANLFLRGGYTYLDAVVQRSFSSDNLLPSTNPSFPGLPIGVYSPLVGARPFRQAPHSGYFAISYKHPRWFVSVSGTLVSRRDDSDFLYDQYGGNTLLLPNRNLDPAYQRIDMTGSYQLHRSVQIYTTIQNVLSQHYDEAFGFAALPLTFRSESSLNLAVSHGSLSRTTARCVRRLGRAHVALIELRFRVRFAAAMEDVHGLPVGGGEQFGANAEYLFQVARVQ